MNATGKRTGLMTTENQPTSKICSICGENCADKARVKNQAGEYCCEGCYDPCGIALGNAASDDDALMESTVVDVEVVEEQFESFSTHHELADDDENRFDGPDLAPSIALETPEGVIALESVPCPGCATPIPGDKICCPACGFSLRTGIIEDSDDPDEASAYGMLGNLRARKFPRIRPKADWAAILPCIPLLMIMSALWFLANDIKRPDQSLIKFFLYFVVDLSVGAAALWICTALWLRLEGRLQVNVARLAAVDALATLIFVGIAHQNIFPVIEFAAALLVFAILPLFVLDLSREEGIHFTIIRFLMKLIYFWTVLSWMHSGDYIPVGGS